MGTDEQVKYWFRSSTFTPERIPLKDDDRIRYITENLYAAQTSPEVMHQISALEGVLLEER